MLLSQLGTRSAETLGEDGQTVESFHEVQLATLNILEDFNAEKSRLEDTERAVLNILEDFTIERGNLEGTQKATLNILEDFNAEKSRLEDTQRAVLNILDDLNSSNEDLRKEHDLLETRVIERTAELQQSYARLQAEIEDRKEGGRTGKGLA